MEVNIHVNFNLFNRPGWMEVSSFPSVMNVCSNAILCAQGYVSVRVWFLEGTGPIGQGRVIIFHFFLQSEGQGQGERGGTYIHNRLHSYRAHCDNEDCGRIILRRVYITTTSHRVTKPQNKINCVFRPLKRGSEILELRR